MKPHKGKLVWIGELIFIQTRKFSDGLPVVKGTRLSVEFILGLFALCWTKQQVTESYPTLSPAAIQAVFAFAAGN
ncbi:DUF433 domain-containing protein [Nostoc sp. JL33]|uniref:DUF433 domain-containing protein n=1 Tax=Nostoc sp. JL33 TaxID=2815396 RepID=UPI0025E8381A|nr:DUF433 domain-containing protein [Nostoc sp. JL33]